MLGRGEFQTRWNSESKDSEVGASVHALRRAEVLCGWMAMSEAKRQEMRTKKRPDGCKNVAFRNKPLSRGRTWSGLLIRGSL